VSDPDVRLYPMHTNTWFYIQVPGAASSNDIKAVSYRYATYRTKTYVEPLQDEAFGSCEGRPSASAVANYVSNNAAGLTRAVAAHHAGDDAGALVSADSLAGEAAGSSIHIFAAVTCMAGLLVSIGLLRVRTARTRTLL